MSQKKSAILYVRVSTEKQDDGYSPEHQEEQLRRYCQQNNLEVVALFREDHSAKTFDRPKFQKMLEDVKKKRLIANILLFLKWDRFSRNASDAYVMISQLNKLGIEPRAIEQPLDLEIPEQKFLLALYLTAPEVENDRRSLNILAGMRKAMRAGRYMGNAPYGYKNIRIERNKAIIVPDPDKSKLLITAYEMMATGLYQIDELRRIMDGKGLKLKKTQFWWILRNPVYIGRIAVAAYKGEPAEIVVAEHEPIITEALFHEVQVALDGRKRVQYSTALCQKEELPLRGFLICPQCGKNMSGSASKGRSARYYYYHCTMGCPERVKAGEVNDRFMALLKGISAHKKVFKSFELIMQDAHGKGKKQAGSEVVAVTRELETVSKRLSNAQMLMLDGSLDADEYKGIKSKLGPEKERLEAKLATLNNRRDDESEAVSFGVYFLSNFDELFTSAGLSLKRRIIGSVFPEKLVYEKGQHRTAISGGTQSLITALGAAPSENKTGGTKNFGRLFGVVEDSGFEPLTSCMPCKEIQFSNFF